MATRRLIIRSFETLGHSYKAKLAERASVAPPAKSRPVATAKPRPPGPMADAKPLPLTKKQRRRKARLDASRWLRANFPALFAAPKPFALGAGRALVKTGIAGGKSRQAIGAAIHFYVHSKGYLTALAAEGSARHGLNGEPVEPVSAEHRAEAEKLLQVIAEKKRPASDEPSGPIQKDD